MIRVEQLSKTYGDVRAVREVSFAVERGELFGLIGPDGAGKTSLIRILTTLLRADSGTATVGGYDVVTDYRAIRNTVGYMPGRFSLYQDLSIEENLHFFATLFGTTVRENYAVIRPIYEQIEPFKKRRAGQLSGGMKQKLALCCALVHQPTVLFLDEPTTGVDVVSRKEFWDMLGLLKSQGMTILVSTPYMDEASLCDRIALIQEGKILSVDTPAAIPGQYRGTLLAVRADEIYALLKDLRALPWLKSCYAFGEFIHCTVGQPADAARLREALTGHSNLEIKEIPASIEDCFIQLMNP